MFRQQKKNLLLLLLGAPGFAGAIEVDYFAGFSVAVFDNINLVSNPTQSETALSLNAGGSMAEDSVNLLLNVNTSLRSIKYKNNLTPDENILNLLSNVIWKINPGQFEWVLTDNFSQSAIDPTVSNAPTNRQNVNTFSTGPNYTIRLNQRNSLRFEARAESYSFEQNFDNNRFTFATRWLHNVNSAFLVSLNNLAETTRFEDDVINSDFDRNDVFLGFNYIRGLNTLDAQYGFTHVSNDNIADINEDRYSLAITNARTRTSSIRISYNNFLTDTGRQVSSQVAGDSNIDTVIGTAANDLFVTESFRFQHINNLSSGNLVFDLNLIKTAYKLQTNLDQEIVSAFITGAWSFPGTNSIRYRVGGTKSEFLDPAISRIDDDFLANITFSHSLRRNVSFSFGVTGLQRESSIESFSYEDLNMIVSLTYNSI